MVRTLINRVDRLVSDETQLRREKDHIRKALQVNRYLDWMMADNRMLDQLDPAQDQGVDGTEEVEEKDEVEQRVPPTTTALEGPCAPVAKKTCTVVLPYVKGVSEQLRRVFRSFDIPTYFKLTSTLQQLLVQPKDKVDEGKDVGSVYHISCDDCDATYVEETERARKTHFSEHCQKSSVGNEVSQHVHMDRPEQGVSLDRVKILTVDSKKFERGVKEAIYIRVAEPSLNKDGGCYIL